MVVIFCLLYSSVAYGGGSCEQARKGSRRYLTCEVARLELELGGLKRELYELREENGHLSASAEWSAELIRRLMQSTGSSRGLLTGSVYAPDGHGFTAKLVDSENHETPFGAVPAGEYSVSVTWEDRFLGSEPHSFSCGYVPRGSEVQVTCNTHFAMCECGPPPGVTP